MNEPDPKLLRKRTKQAEKFSKRAKEGRSARENAPVPRHEFEELKHQMAAQIASLENDIRQAYAMTTFLKETLAYKGFLTNEEIDMTAKRIRVEKLRQAIVFMKASGRPQEDIEKLCKDNDVPIAVFADILNATRTAP